ncbi:hypothetical protein [Nocardioides sp.]|uniref:hypothetical protein n=1 Tax=Nocardioides sp. TaxID=35761 RepID=UPI003562EAF3
MSRSRETWVVVPLVTMVFLGMLGLSRVAADPGTAAVGAPESAAAPRDPATTPVDPVPAATQSPESSPAPAVDEPATTEPKPTLPGGRTKIFGANRFLVAYYGSARTSALGVLGEDPPGRMIKRLREAAAKFETKRSKTQVVFELIVTVADAYPGPDGDYAHDINRADVQRYIKAAHRYGALVLLDIQPGRAGFLTAAKRWAWALKDPYVGLAIDPEWRMGRFAVPGQVIGSVNAAEVNRVTGWLSDLTKRHNLPQKLFVLHQFRTDMINDINDISPRRGLVMVQHVDGFGTPGQKLDTFRTVIKPHKFFLGFKLFYDEDRRLMRPREVRAIRPRVQFVSYQ